MTKEDENFARQKVETLLNAYPNLKGIIAFDSNSVPGACEAVKRAGKVGKVAIIGNSTPGQDAALHQGRSAAIVLSLGSARARRLDGAPGQASRRWQAHHDGMEVPGHGKIPSASRTAKRSSWPTRSASRKRTSTTTTSGFEGLCSGRNDVIKVWGNGPPARCGGRPAGAPGRHRLIRKNALPKLGSKLPPRTAKLAVPPIH